MAFQYLAEIHVYWEWPLVPQHFCVLLREAFMLCKKHGPCLGMASGVYARRCSHHGLLRCFLLATQVTTIFFVYPSLLLIYFGEAAYLATFPADFARSYFAAIPQALFWPMFLIATASALVGSQSLISSAFSVARQSAVMSCFPPVRVHPFSNYCLPCPCLWLLSDPLCLVAMAGLAYPANSVLTVLLVCFSLSTA